MRRRRNCDGETPGEDADKLLTVELLGLTQCPWTAIPREAFEVVLSYRRWTRLGILPYGGSSMGEQPQSTVEGFEVCAEAERMMREHREAVARNEQTRAILAMLAGGRR